MHEYPVRVKFWVRINGKENGDESEKHLVAPGCRM